MLIRVPSKPGETIAQPKLLATCNGSTKFFDSGPSRTGISLRSE